MPTAGEKIRALRKKHGLTAAKLAEMTGFTQGYISQLERGITGFSSEGLQKIATVFSVSPALLQDPQVDLDRLTDISDILATLSRLPQEKVELVRQMILALDDERKS